MSMVVMSKPVFVPAAAVGGGSFTDGVAGYTFAPPSGTSNTVPYEFWGGKASAGGNIDAGTQLADASKSNWTNPSAAPKYDNTQTYSRSKSLGFDARYTKASNPGNSGAFGLGFDMGLGVTEYVFEGNVYFGINPSANLTASQWKVHRFAYSDSIVDGNVCFYTAHWRTGGVDGDGDFVVISNGHVESDSGTYVTSVAYLGQDFSSIHGERFPDQYPANNTGRWYRYRFWCKQSTSQNATDGQWTMDMWRLDTGAKVMTNYDINVRMHEDTRIGRWFELQNYHGNASPGPPGGVDGTADSSTTFEVPGDGYAYWDDVRLSYGTGSRREIVGTNASTWAASTKWWFQPWTSWTSGTVTLTPNNPLGTITHLYELDSSGVPVSTNGTAV